MPTDLPTDPNVEALIAKHRHRVLMGKAKYGVDITRKERYRQRNNPEQQEQQP